MTGFFRADGVAQVTRVAQRDLLVPALITHHVLAAEGVEAADADIQVGQCHCDR